jgi:hypothetical protein
MVAYVYITPNFRISVDPSTNTLKWEFFNSTTSSWETKLQQNISTGDIQTIGQILNLGVHFVKTASPTPGVSGAYGSAVTLSASPNKSILPLSATLTWGGTFGTGETVTIRITATFSDNSTANITKSATATGSLSLNPADLQGLMKNGVYIKSLAVDSSSSAASTSVTTSATIYAVSL